MDKKSTSSQQRFLLTLYNLTPVDTNLWGCPKYRGQLRWVLHGAFYLRLLLELCNMIFVCILLNCLSNLHHQNISSMFSLSMVFILASYVQILVLTEYTFLSTGRAVQLLQLQVLQLQCTSCSSSSRNLSPWPEKLAVVYSTWGKMKRRQTLVRGRMHDWMHNLR